jgi:very-short-patch-repair endonuclease
MPNPNSYNRIRGTTPNVETAARRLREDLTPAEAVLWQALKKRQLNNLKFRNQHPVGHFILDFYCPSHKLVIEVDGGIHDRQVEYDNDRSKQLESHGYHIIRFRNDEILNNLDFVLQCIRETCDRLEAPRPPILGEQEKE